MSYGCFVNDQGGYLQICKARRKLLTETEKSV